MNGANHDISGFSTYPFKVFGDDWQDVDDFIEDLKVFCSSVPKKDNRSSLEILREIRHGGKY